MQFAIFYNTETNPTNKTYALEVSEILEKLGLFYFLNPAADKFSQIDIAIAVGGDGTVLYVSNLLADHRIPIAGINFGHRGYLCELGRDKIEDGIRLIVKGRYKVVERTRIQAKIKRENEETASLEALNEISVGGINRTVHLEADIITPERTFRTQISGDGLIVSTQTGSTAYNINAGGPMLLEDAFSIVANNAFFSSTDLLPITKSLVVPTETAVKLKDISHNPSNLPYVIADGQKSFRIRRNDLITVKKAKNKNYFIKF